MTGVSRRLPALATISAAALLAGCGGSPNTPTGSVVGSPGGPNPPPTQLVSVKLSVTVPASHGMRPSYVSPNTLSVSVQLASVNGAGVSGVNATVVNTAPKAPHCKPANDALTCTSTISGSPGSDIFTVTTYEGQSATGAVLSVGTASAHISSGGGALSISNQLSIDIDGVIAKLSLGVSPNRVKRGKPADAAVSLRALDASGAEIVGSSNYQSPVILSIQGDTTQSFALKTTHQSGSSISIQKPTANITLAYDGNPNASSVTVTATSTGDANANTPFALVGRRPPPPPGTIYALNFGANNGLGATVTEYPANANGNVAPLRTLNLNAKLYARSISVDSAGNLYVGYLDSPTGLSGSTGLPDSKNIVAIYAPGASGNDQPAATLVADPGTNSVLYPLFSAFNPGDGLTTFGATSVDKNTGDAILTYAQGASGPATPQNALDFGFPTLNFQQAPTTGLTVDGSGNVYFAGALYSALGPKFAIYVAAVADIGNPQTNPARTIPWDTTTELTPYETSNVALDSSEEILVANEAVNLSGTVSCQGRVNVFAAGASGGVTDNSPLRVLTLNGVFTQNPNCAPFTSPLAAYFPEITVYGSNLFVADDFNNAIGVFPSGRGGTVKASRSISGSATGLNAPIAVVVAKSSSGPAIAGPVKNGRTSSSPVSCARPTCALTRSIRIPSP
jgi:hypothetical protein